MNQQTRNSVRTMTVCAMLVACNVVLSRFLSINTSFFTINVSFIPTMLAGMLFGPFWGAAVGGFGDFIGAMLFPFGTFFPGFTLTAALAGMTYGLLLHPKKREWFSGKTLFLRALIAVLFIGTVLHIGLNSYWLYMIMGKGVFAMMPARVLETCGMMPIKMMVILMSGQMLHQIPMEKFDRGKMA